MQKRIDNQEEKITLVAVLLAGSCFLTYYFHTIREVGTVFTHFFYVPIVLSSIWWKRKGILAAIFLAAFLVFSHHFLRDYMMAGNDYFRALLFVVIGFVVALLSERLAKNEEMLRESAEKYRSMMAAMDDAAYICSPDFFIDYMNPVMIKRIGRDATGEICHKVINDLDERCPWCVHDRIQQGESAQIDIISPQDNRSYHVSYSPVFYENGSILKMTIYRDTTERKQVEKERILLATAVEQAAESIIISDRPGTIQYVNPAFERLSGFTPEEIIGQNFRILKSDKHDEAFYRKMYAVISRGKIWKGRTTNRMKDGTLLEFEAIISPIHDSSGEIINFVSVNRDITQEVELRAQLRQAQKMEAIGTLAGGIAHDFNNILFPIVGYVEMMLEDAPADSPTHDRLKQVMKGTKRAGDLVKQILAFSRRTEDKQKPIKVQTIIKEVLKLTRSTLPVTIEIRQHISNQCGLVMADFTQIHQVAMNLMTNAYKAMQDEGGKMEVTLKEVELGLDDLTDPSMTPGAYVCLTVADTGLGMDQSVISRIFEPYFTTKENGKGTGLGLAVAYGIVKNFNGDIKVYSELGEGTAFHVYLPVIKTEVTKEEMDTVAPVQKGNERTLLVDDEEPIVSMEKEMLERLGYQVTARTSSVEALEAFRAAPDKFDLVITDMTMPNMTGVQLSQKLLEISPGIPIIICTGFSEQINEQRIKTMGIRGYVMKPVVASELGKTIRAALDQED